jgi:hypothetical protein
MSKPIIPFGWWPGHWGLKGSTRERARAEYELTGMELEEKLLEISIGHDPDALALQLLELQKKHGKISDYDYDTSVAVVTHKTDESSLGLAKLDIDLAHGKIIQDQYDRKRADLLKEPWVSMPRIHWDPTGSGRTYFELDYNEHFISFLHSNGYEGEEDDIVNRWLNDVCISISEEITGLDAELVTPTRRTE